MVWAEDKKGNFSVRSAYGLAREIGVVSGNTSCSNPAFLHGAWRGVWNMNLPNKIKHFSWKACNRILATKDSLFRRKITANNFCEECGRHETTMHLLCFCNQSTKIWSSCKISLPFNVQESWSFLDTFSRLRCCWEAQHGKLECWVSICWGIWKSRNEVQCGGKKRPGPIIVSDALRFLENYHSANVKPSQSSSDTQNSAVWKPPPPGYFKVNVDGALFTKSKQSGVGVIVQDEVGNVVAAMCRKLDLPLGALETEAKALEIGMTFAEEVGLRDVVFEGDS
ncbi:putative ribonuclease h protein [Quercus suber]|uniref:Ribonuclease h protein n=1 Tax=Quercus suber TaxID=58331 RepID=A0AAW0J1Y0_QUESU